MEERDQKERGKEGGGEEKTTIAFKEFRVKVKTKDIERFVDSVAALCWVYIEEEGDFFFKYEGE